MYHDEPEEFYVDAPVIPDDMSDEAEIGNIAGLSLSDLVPKYMQAFGKRLSVEDRGTWERVVLNTTSLSKPLSQIKKAQYQHPGLLKGASLNYEQNFLSSRERAF